MLQFWTRGALEMYSAYRWKFYSHRSVVRLWRFQSAHTHQIIVDLQIVDNSKLSMLIIPQHFLSSSNVSKSFADILPSFLTKKMEKVLKIWFFWIIICIMCLLWCTVCFHRWLIQRAMFQPRCSTCFESSSVPSVCFLRTKQSCDRISTESFWR